MASQGQDAKFFQRGKIQVRDHDLSAGMEDLKVVWLGIPCGAGGGGDQGQEVYEAEDGVKEDCREYHDGQ